MANVESIVIVNQKLVDAIKYLTGRTTESILEQVWNLQDTNGHKSTSDTLADILAECEENADRADDEAYANRTQEDESANMADRFNDQYPVYGLLIRRRP